MLAVRQVKEKCETKEIFNVLSEASLTPILPSVAQISTNTEDHKVPDQSLPQQLSKEPLSSPLASNDGSVHFFKDCDHKQVKDFSIQKSQLLKFFAGALYHPLQPLVPCSSRAECLSTDPSPTSVTQKDVIAAVLKPSPSVLRLAPKIFKPFSRQKLTEFPAIILEETLDDAIIHTADVCELDTATVNYLNLLSSKIFAMPECNPEPMPNFLALINTLKKLPRRSLFEWHLALAHLGRKKILRLAEINLISITDPASPLDCHRSKDVQKTICEINAAESR